MLYNLYLNQKMAKEENISGNALIIFETFKQLMALPYIDQVMIEDERYTYLHRNMVLAQIPFFIKSERTLSRAIKELIDAELLKSNDNNRFPAYTFTDKGISYMTSSSQGEIAENIQTNKKSKKKPILALNKKTRIWDLKEEYMSILSARAKTISEKHKVPFSEFDIFLEYHSKNGNKFVNWLSAYSTWCRNYNKFNANKGEKKKGDLYYG